VPGIVTLEEIAWEEARYPDETESRGDCLDIGGALATGAIGANIHRFGPGQESARYHCHETVEELFLVLEGHPTLRLDGREVPLHKHDIVFCPPWSAHTFRNESGAVAEILMMSGRCEGSDVVYPGWKVEEMTTEPAPEGTRDPRVRNLAEIPWEDDPNGRTYGGRRTIGAMLPLKTLAGSLVTMRPGALYPPYHAHSKAEELYLVLEGKPTLLVDGVEGGLRAGAVAHFPEGMPHAIANRTDEAVRIFALWGPIEGDRAELPTPPHGWEGPQGV
jgi:uncharacterized cupin superfamily protein